MSRYIQASLLSAAVVLAGCSSTSELLQSKKVDYKSVSKEKTVSLEVPPDLTMPSKDDRYAVPDVASKGSATYSAYAAERINKLPQQTSTPATNTPTTTASPAANTTPIVVGVSDPAVLPNVGDIRVERDGNARWLVVPVAPEKLWMQVKEFWQDNGFVINIEMPEAGVMETDWAENRAKIPQGFMRDLLTKALDSLYSTAERDKFRTRLERSATGGSEIYISERSMREVFITEGKEQTRWEPKAPDPEIEAEMLRRLMVRLGVEETRSKALIAVAPTQVERARLQRGSDGAGVLRMDESFDRAWRRVGLVLDRVGFTVEDRDRSKGLYFVRYVDPEADTKKDEKGFLSKLAFWRSDSKDGKQQVQYRVYLKSEGTGSSVQVMSPEGGIENSDSGRKILNLLYQQLK